MDSVMGYLIIAAIAIVLFVIKVAVGKGANALERQVRSGAASSEDELLKTVVVFRTSATLQAVRQAVKDNIIVKGDIWAGRMSVRHDSERGIEWEVGSVAVGGGFKAQLVYRAEDGATVGEYAITSHSTKGGVSPFIKKMTELRNQVITAFRAADPNVQITTEEQNVRRKTSWL